MMRLARVTKETVSDYTKDDKAMDPVTHVALFSKAQPILLELGYRTAMLLAEMHGRDEEVTARHILMGMSLCYFLLERQMEKGE